MADNGTIIIRIEDSLKVTLISEALSSLTILLYCIIGCSLKELYDLTNYLQTIIIILFFFSSLDLCTRWTMDSSH